jgi:NAD(P)-dependent dehydrogenase (short-subunit alcohol dehydrogenase family)
MAQGPSLQGASALVTGADTALGFAVAERLGRAGVRLALHVNDEAASERLEKLGASLCFSGAADDEAIVRNGLGEVGKALGSLNILVTCHATPMTGGLFEQDAGDYWTHLHRSLTGSFLFAREAAPALKQAGWGRVALVSSGWAQGGPGLSAVASAAGGLNILCKTLARELGPHGVCVNSVAPAFVDSDWLACDARGLRLSETELRRQAPSLAPAGRLGTVAEVAETIRLMCEPRIGAAVAQTLQCSGGYFRQRF